MWCVDSPDKDSNPDLLQKAKVQAKGSQRDEDLWARGAVMAVKYVRSTKN